MEQPSVTGELDGLSLRETMLGLDRNTFVFENGGMDEFSSEDSSSSSSSSSSPPASSTKYSNAILRYITDILMDEEDDLERKPCMLQECLRLQAAEKSFYDALGQDDANYGGSGTTTSVDSNSNSSSSTSTDEFESGFPENSKGSREKRGHETEQDGRGSKVSAVSRSEEEPAEILEEVLRVQSGTSKTSAESGGGGGKKRRPKNTTTVVDLWSLLSQCAQAVGSHDHRNANDLLKQIRQHCSPLGDGLERLAHYFAIGLEARLGRGPGPDSGPGTPPDSYSFLATAADMLKAYKLFVEASPLQRMSNLLTTKTIEKLVQNQARVHIIDLGICYGFQWPCLIKRLSQRPGGPPRLRMTGIDLPQPGFRPAERLQETGRRLQNFCNKFNVPFEYNCLAQKWETIPLEDLRVDRDEITVVNCLYRLKNLPDETVTPNCPRDAVLKLIRRIDPNLFIHGVVNGSYSAPFFVTRFREALFHFSSLFDMYEANVPREDPQRLTLEKGLFGRDAVNVIACEGAERVERPETYKQWQVRNHRAGFKQLALDPQLVHQAKEMVRTEYHKDFLVDEDGKWVLQGWKGRILNAFSVWTPA